MSEADKRRIPPGRSRADCPLESARNLRRRAEERVRPLSAAVLETLSPDKVRRLVHDLQVHQVELAMQNEELSRARDEVDAVRSRYFQLYELAPVGYMTVSQEGDIQEANLRAAMLLGVNRKELLGRPFTRLILPEDQDLFYFQRKKILESGEMHSCELRLLKGDGEHFWARLDCDLEDGGKGPAFFRMTISDITDIKRTAEALRQSEEKYRTIADFTYDWEYWMGPDRRFLYCSSACERITGYRADEFQNDSGLFLSIVHPEDREGVERHMRQGSVQEAGSCGTPSVLEFRVIARSGEIRWIGHACCAVRGRDGCYLGRRGCNRDITERKTAEAERKALQEELYQSRKLESIGRLAGGVAHDFNNMLSVIIGYAELTLDRFDPGLQEFTFMEQILKAARHSAELTRQLLAFARKQPMNPRVLELNEAVSKMLKLLRRLVGEDIALTFTPGAAPWPVYIDPSQVDQILANLCVNARDAMADGGGVFIETRNVSLPPDAVTGRDGCVPGEYVLLTVRDTGCGMDEAVVRNIFEPFFTTKGPGQGTGMGLATVYGIVRQNGGCIGVESTPGEGTIFSVFLPRAGTSEETAQGAEAQGTALPHGSMEKILLVEDSPNVLSMSREMLKQLGYAVYAASGPTEALRLAEEALERIDLLVTDIIMPEMNGMELAERISRIMPRVKTLFMSGYAPEHIANYAELEASGVFLAKPFSQKELAHKVRELLDR